MHTAAEACLHKQGLVAPCTIGPTFRRAIAGQVCTRLHGPELATQLLRLLRLHPGFAARLICFPSRQAGSLGMLMSLGCSWDEATRDKTEMP